MEKVVEEVLLYTSYSEGDETSISTYVYSWYSGSIMLQIICFDGQLSPSSCYV